MHKVVDEYNAFKLNTYNEVLELVGGQEGQDGKFYMTWVIASEYDSSVGGGIPVTKADGGYRNLPVKIILGDRDQAIENLKWLLGQIEGGSPPPGPGPGPPKPPPSDDVPF